MVNNTNSRKTKGERAHSRIKNPARMTTLPVIPDETLSIAEGYARIRAGQQGTGRTLFDMGERVLDLYLGALS